MRPLSQGEFGLVFYEGQFVVLDRVLLVTVVLISLSEIVVDPRIFRTKLYGLAKLFQSTTEVAKSGIGSCSPVSCKCFKLGLPGCVRAWDAVDRAQCGVKVLKRSTEIATFHKDLAATQKGRDIFRIQFERSRIVRNCV